MRRPSFERAKAISARYKQRYYNNQTKLGLLALRNVQEAIKAFGCSRQTAEYWKQKVGNPLFHAGTHGGAR